MKNLILYPFIKFRPFLSCLSADTVENIKKLNTPKKICGVDCPDNLQEVSFSVLVGLQHAQGSDYYTTSLNVCKELFPTLTTEEIEQETTVKILGVVSMVTRELQRINKLFDTLGGSLSSEAIQAGAKNLNFGIFGIIDAYALRMGITNHDEAFNTPWARVFQCLKIDNEKAKFEDRLRKIYQNKK